MLYRIPTIPFFIPIGKPAAGGGLLMKTLLGVGRSGRTFAAEVSIYKNSWGQTLADLASVSPRTCLAILPTPNLCFSSNFGHFIKVQQNFRNFDIAWRKTCLLFLQNIAFFPTSNQAIEDP